MRYIYNLALGLWAVSILPYTIYQYFRHKKYRGNLLSRLGFQLPRIDGKKRGKRIWVHATSLGETKAVEPFVKRMREDHPDALIIYSSTTETGFREASKHLGLIDQVFYMPLDFSLLMKRLVKSIKPDLFVLVESDYWYNLFSELKKNGAKIALLNGRMSTASYNNFKKVPAFTKKLFNMIDILCVQNKEIEEKFRGLGVEKEKITVTGNIKFDVESKVQEVSDMIFPKEKRCITVASTHEKEEEDIVAALEKMDPSVVILLAPRHPERFDGVATLLTRMKVPFRRISEEETSDERVVLVDRIGVLEACFGRSAAAIVGGSFVKHVGGHNIYEPARMGVPVIYGPYMHKQQSLVKILDQFGIGRQVELEQLNDTVGEILAKREHSLQKLKEMKGTIEGATERSWEKIKQL